MKSHFRRTNAIRNAWFLTHPRLHPFQFYCDRSNFLIDTPGSGKVEFLVDSEMGSKLLREVAIVRSDYAESGPQREIDELEGSLVENYISVKLADFIEAWEELKDFKAAIRHFLGDSVAISSSIDLAELERRFLYSDYEMKRGYRTYERMQKSSF